MLNALIESVNMNEMAYFSIETGSTKNKERQISGMRTLPSVAQPSQTVKRSQSFLNQSTN